MYFATNNIWMIIFLFENLCCFGSSALVSVLHSCAPYWRIFSERSVESLCSRSALSFSKFLLILKGIMRLQHIVFVWITLHLTEYTVSLFQVTSLFWVWSTFVHWLYSLWLKQAIVFQFLHITCTAVVVFEGSRKWSTLRVTTVHGCESISRRMCCEDDGRMFCWFLYGFLAQNRSTPDAWCLLDIGSYLCPQ